MEIINILQTLSAIAGLVIITFGSIIAKKHLKRYGYSMWR